MKKRKQISQQAIARKRLERDARRLHTLKCDEARSKGFAANTETLLAQLEAQYEAGKISITQYNQGMQILGKEEVPGEDEELGF